MRTLSFLATAFLTFAATSAHAGGSQQLKAAKRFAERVKRGGPTKQTRLVKGTLVHDDAYEVGGDVVVHSSKADGTSALRRFSFGTGGAKLTMLGAIQKTKDGDIERVFDVGKHKTVVRKQIIRTPEVAIHDDLSGGVLRRTLIYPAKTKITVETRGGE